MKKTITLLLAILVLLTLSACSPKTSEQPTDKEVSMELLADCLSSKGIVMYGKATCSACAATRKMFGESFHKIKEIECDPNQPNNEVDLCLKKEILKTPTWILEKDGADVKRADGYLTADELKETFGC